MDMSFLNGDTRQALTQALDQIAATHPPAPRLLTLIAGRAQAAQGHVDACLNTFPDVAQFVVPHFENLPLMEYLQKVPNGLAGCLISHRFRNLGLPSVYFPSAACRQLLLKSVSERCCSLPAVRSSTDFFENRYHHLSTNYANMLYVRDFQTEWQSFQRALGCLFVSLAPLDAQDVEHLQEVVFFLHENGLQAEIDLSLDQMLELFFRNAVAVHPHLERGPHKYDDCATWYPLFIEWIFVYTDGWPNRQLYTALAAFVLYGYIKSQTVLPLKGMSARKMSPALDRAMRLAKLDSLALYASSEQQQFRPPNICWLDIKDRTITMPIWINALLQFDATAYNHKHLHGRVSMYVSRNATTRHQQVQNYEQSEAYFFTQLAEAESSYQWDRFSDTLTVLLELLANMCTISPPHPRFFLHPKLVMPELYLLLAKTLAQIYASDLTILACFQQARYILDRERPEDENSGLAYKMDDQFALAILVTLNMKGLLQQAMAFFQHVMEENGPMLLKQSYSMHALCVEYIQNTAFAWLENQLAWLVGFNQFHKNCSHSFQDLLQEKESDPRSLINRMLNVIIEIKNLIARNQTFIRSGQFSRTATCTTWGSSGKQGQETTLECLSLKARFYEWMIKFVGMKIHCTPWNEFHRQELSMLVDVYDNWMTILSPLHPLRLEACAIRSTLGCIWTACTDPSHVPANRHRHSNNKYAQFQYLLDVIQARSGTRFSHSLGTVTFKLYVWLSVGCAFSGNGRNDGYSRVMLKQSGLCLLKSSRGLAYRLPLISLLVNHLGWCHKMLRGNQANTVFPISDPEHECNCKTQEPFQSHGENHSYRSRQIIQQGFHSLENFPLAALLATRRTGGPRPSFIDAHNVFLQNRLLRGEDGPLIAKAVHFSTCASLRAWKGGHLGCTNM